MLSRISKNITHLFLTLSIAVVSLYSDTNVYLPTYQSCEEDVCCQTRPSWGRLLTSALLASVVIGAVVGASVGNRREGRRGPCGACGDRGPIGSCAEADGTNTVTFGGSFLSNTALPGASLIFFVTLPDGSIIRSSPIAYVNGLTQLPFLTTTALFGRYSTGVELTIGPTIVPIVFTTQLNISTDPSSNIAINTVVNELATEVNFQPSASAQAAQYTLDYTYYPEHATTP